ncbi:hypothetical protein PG985_007547 [Apiospora marii]|uniref:F-box domain-containing protein n=1 Tax=Apiospora marii TaxID=335849 RepID=A0ABR1SQ30_9PEZI
MAPNPRQKKPPARPRPSQLESLPVELLLAILSASPSTDDLHSLIRASPVAYRVFLPAKGAVLLSILSRDLGSTLRDAIAATLIARRRLRDLVEAGQLSTARDQRRRIRGAIREYAALLRDPRFPVDARGLPVESVVVLVRASRDVQAVVDAFARSRLPALREIHPDAGGPLSKRERQRLATALFRHQFLARIECRAFQLRRELCAQLLDLFPPWERQQLVDAHCFVFNSLQAAFMMCVCGDRDGECPIDPAAAHGEEAEATIRKTACEVGAVRRRLAMDPELVLSGTKATPAQMSHSRAAWRPQESWWAVPGYNFLIGGPLPCGSSWVRVPPALHHLRDVLYQQEDAAPALEFAGDDDDGDGDHDNGNDPVILPPPPFAWTDGHDGLACRRWGIQLPREVPAPGQQQGPDTVTISQGVWMTFVLRRWRWLGFAFYDRARVERLKARMPAYSTGWLNRPWPSDEECRASEEFRMQESLLY